MFAGGHLYHELDRLLVNQKTGTFYETIFLWHSNDQRTKYTGFLLVFLPGDPNTIAPIPLKLINVVHWAAGGPVGFVVVTIVVRVSPASQPCYMYRTHSQNCLVSRSEVIPASVSSLPQLVVLKIAEP